MPIPQLTVTVPAADVEEVQQQFANLQVQAKLVGSEGFDGVKAVELLVPLISATIPALVTVYKARVAADKDISYKSDDFEVKGVSNETLTRLVELQQRRHSSEK